MSKKSIFIVLSVACIASVVVLGGAWGSPQLSLPVEQYPVSAASKQKQKENGLLRYDVARDPRFSAVAAQNYYALRAQMIREYHGGGRISGSLAIVKSGSGSISDLANALGSVRQCETIEALPYVMKLLEHADAQVQRMAAEVLCSFGDRRGFDFILEQRGKADGFSNWHTLLAKVLIDDGRTTYNDELVKMMRSTGTSTMSNLVESYETAKLLAELGNDSGVPLIAEVVRKYPPKGPDSVIALAPLSHPLVKEIADELARSGLDDRVRQAARILLARQGDQAAQQQIVEAARKLTSLPQPQNADGSYKPGLKPKVIGGVTPAWDGNAYYALEHGMEAVDPQQAVPVLRDIALHADNVRFSRMAIKSLAKIGDETARDALWEVARSIQKKRRTFEDTLFTTTGQALMLFNDPTSTALAATMFHGDKHGMEAAQFMAETRGWDGLFKLELYH